MQQQQQRTAATTATATLTLALAALLLASTAAYAYRAPARVLLNKAMERAFDRAAKTLRVEMDTQTYEITGNARGVAVNERWMFQAPSMARRETDAPEGARTETRVDDKLLVKVVGQPDKAGKAPIDLLVDQVTAGPPLTDDQASDRLLAHMKALGVNTEVVAFARFDGRVAYLIGSKPWEYDKPQVWLDKDTLLLVRVVMVQKSDDPKSPPKRTDIRYLGWGSPLGGNWFPSTIEVWQDDHLVKRSTVRNVEKGVSFDAGMFNAK